ALGQADQGAGAAGEQAQLQRHFELLPRGWPVAALSRMRDAGSDVQASWLRADPAYVRPDINGARLLACGEAMALDRKDVDALLPALRPLFGDSGFTLDAPDPHRWYLRLPRESRLPVFVDPADALGAELFDQLPGSDDGNSAEGRRWRALLSEAQVVLHNHPRNAARLAAGRLPVNSLWFWGAGGAPDHVTARHDVVESGETLLLALADAAQADAWPRPHAFERASGNRLVDLRDLRDQARWQDAWLGPAITEARHGHLGRLVLDFQDGLQFSIEPAQRWRFWRKPVRTLAS